MCGPHLSVFGNQTIGSGCNMWLAAQEGAGSPRGENSHISSASGGSGPIYAPGGVGEVTMGRPLGVGAGQGSRGDHEWLKPVEPGQKLVCEGSCYPRGRTCEGYVDSGQAWDAHQAGN